MIAVSLYSSGPEIVELPRPQIEQPGDAIVMVTTTAIGHWEIDQAKGPGTSQTPGAQFAGIVVETGDRVAQVNIDDLVVAMCVGTLSDGRRVRFGHDSLAGGHAEYVRVPLADQVLVKTTAGAEERTVFAGGEVALGIRAAGEAIEVAGDGPIAVLGCDSSALAAIAWVRYRRGRNGTIFAHDPHPARLAAAKSLGASAIEFDDIGEAGLAAVITGMSVGTSSTRMVAGIPAFSSLPSSSGSSGDWPTFEETRRAEMAIRLRQIDLTPLVSTVLPLDEAAEGYRITVEEAPGIRAVLLKP